MQTLKKNPIDEYLLYYGIPWLESHGSVSIDQAINIGKEYNADDISFSVYNDKIICAINFHTNSKYSTILMSINGTRFELEKRGIVYKYEIL